MRTNTDTGLRAGPTPERRVVAAAAAVAAASVVAAAAGWAETVADVAGDWEAPQDDTAVGGTLRGWSYLRSNAPTGGAEQSLVPSPNTGDVGGPGFAGDSGTGRRLPAVVGDDSNGEDYELFRDGDLNAAVPGTDVLVHADSVFADSQFVILRYTISPADVTSGHWAAVSGSFRNLVASSGGDPGFDGVEVAVYHGATRLFWYDPTNSEVLPEADGTFDVNAAVEAGDTVSFVVGLNGTRFADETALRARIDVGPAPAVTPARGTAGAEITVDGSDFGRRAPRVSLRPPDGGRRVRLSVADSTDARITCRVPRRARLVAGEYELLVRRRGGPEEVAGSFTVGAPRVAAVSPSGAAPGSELLVEGERFGPSRGQVKIGGRKARVLEWSDGAVRCRVDARTPAGLQDVHVTTRATTTTTAVRRVLIEGT